MNPIRKMSSRLAERDENLVEVEGVLAESEEGKRDVSRR